MVAVDPKDANWLTPFFSQILRETFEHSYKLFLTGASKIIREFRVTAALRQITFAWVGERIAGPDFAIAAHASSFTENNCRRAFERADLEDTTDRRWISTD